MKLKPTDLENGPFAMVLFQDHQVYQVNTLHVQITDIITIVHIFDENTIQYLLKDHTNFTLCKL